MFKTLAFDQSSTKTGWSLFDGDTYIDSGVIDKHKISDTDKRVGEMGAAICDKIEELKPDHVVIENIQQQSGVSTVILLARLQGFILGWCYVHNIDVEIIGPSQWRAALKIKQGAGIKRKELKAQSIEYVKNKYGLNVSEDEAEAVCINDGARTRYMCDGELWEAF